MLERTCSELRGTSGLELEDIDRPYQRIISSFSLGVPVEDTEGLKEAVSTFVSRAAEKLREQGSLASVSQVYIKTEKFKNTDLQHNDETLISIPDPTDNTLALTHAAITGLRKIYKQGYESEKAGVMLTEKATRQESLPTMWESGCDHGVDGRHWMPSMIDLDVAVEISCDGDRTALNDEG